VAYEGLKKARPEIPLYGPCGTGDFSQWMKKVTSRLTKTGYVLDVSVPWSLAGGDDPKPTFGFDVGVNGGDPGKANRRKTQMMLFGTQHNAVSAADFGSVRLR